MRRQPSILWFVGEALAIAVLLVVPALNWWGFTPPSRTSPPNTDDRRLAFQALSEALKAGTTAVSIAFGAIGVLKIVERNKSIPMGLTLAACYGLLALVFALWDLLALPQFVVTAMVTDEMKLNILLALHFTFLACMFYRIFVWVFYSISELSQPDATVNSTDGSNAGVEKKIRELEELKQILSRIQIGPQQP